ncbi:MAG: hypothetical protein PHI67_08715 [Candidatus Methanomethylophilaceae archaeon]|nr:hypothetical protein [Candidatus Methanomethylophilaceae archaeon]
MKPETEALFIKPGDAASPKNATHTAIRCTKQVRGKTRVVGHCI